jgi:hydrogenase expression/formation protein HypC
MSLGVPGLIIEVRGDEATVEFWGVQKTVRLDILDEPVVAGDYVIAFEGCVVRRIAPADVADTLGMYEVVLCEE